MTTDHNAPALEVIDYSKLPEPWEPRTLKHLRRRIDACLNACEGVRTEALEENGPSFHFFALREALRARDEYKEQRDDAERRLEQYSERIDDLLVASQEARLQLDANELALAAETLDRAIAYASGAPLPSDTPSPEEDLAWAK